MQHEVHIYVSLLRCEEILSMSCNGGLINHCVAGSPLCSGLFVATAASLLRVESQSASGLRSVADILHSKTRNLPCWEHRQVRFLREFGADLG